MVTPGVTGCVAWQHCLEELQSVSSPIRKPLGEDAFLLDIGGCTIKLVFHSRSLRALVLPAFEHLLSDGVEVLTLHLHDFESAPVGPKLTMLLDPPEDGGSVRLMDSPALTCFAQAQGKVVSVIDWNRDEAYWMVRSTVDVSYIERSSPLRPLLTHWLGKHERYLAHGAAVGDSRGAVFITGHGGAGKSTTALVCLEAGFEYIADDHCLLEAGLEPAVNSLFSTGKLAEDQLKHFSVLAASAEVKERPPTEKVVLYLSRLAALPISKRLPLRAVLHAHITGRQETAWRQLTAAHAFRAMAPSCALHFPSARAGALSCFSRLAKDVPSYVLELGTDRGSISTAIHTLLASVPKLDS